MTPKTMSFHPRAASFLAPFSQPFPKIDSLMHFGYPLVSFWLPLAPFWLPFGSLVLVLGVHFLTFGVSQRSFAHVHLFSDSSFLYDVESRNARNFGARMEVSRVMGLQVP